ncbi:hypothetical protein M758_11G108800 [Ceratodon purpureus]|nr:hypothetical protein M758_11G108800 [Ceratodon purpureus]
MRKMQKSGVLMVLIIYQMKSRSYISLSLLRCLVHCFKSILVSIVVCSGYVLCLDSITCDFDVLEPRCDDCTQAVYLGLSLIRFSDCSYPSDHTASGTNVIGKIIQERWRMVGKIIQER